MRLIPLHKTDETHLAEVITQMETLGAPTLKAVYLDAYNAYMLLEGTHRLAAALALGLTPVIETVDVDLDDAVEVHVSDWDSNGWTIEHLIDDIARNSDRNPIEIN